MRTSLEKSFVKIENMNDEKFYSSLIEELDQIIEDELSKDYEEINAEVVDDCCLALQSIYELQSGEGEELNNIVNISTIIKKYSLCQRKKRIVSVACAAVAILAIGVTSFTLSSETLAEGNAFKTTIGRFEEPFKKEELTSKPLTTESPEASGEKTTEIQITTESPEASGEKTTEIQITEELSSSHNAAQVTGKQIKGISAIIAPGNIMLYHNVEEISLKNTFVRVNYTNGESEIISISKCNVTIGEPKASGETKITINYKGFETYIYATVLEE